MHFTLLFLWLGEFRVIFVFELWVGSLSSYLLLNFFSIWLLFYTFYFIFLRSLIFLDFILTVFLWFLFFLNRLL